MNGEMDGEIKRMKVRREKTKKNQQKSEERGMSGFDSRINRDLDWMERESGKGKVNAGDGKGRDSRKR